MASQSREPDHRTCTGAPVFAIAFCYGKNFVGYMLINLNPRRSLCRPGQEHLLRQGSFHRDQR